MHVTCLHSIDGKSLIRHQTTQDRPRLNGEKFPSSGQISRMNTPCFKEVRRSLDRPGSGHFSKECTVAMSRPSRRHSGAMSVPSCRKNRWRQETQNRLLLPRVLRAAAWVRSFQNSELFLLACLLESEVSRLDLVPRR